MHKHCNETYLKNIKKYKGKVIKCSMDQDAQTWKSEWSLRDETY